MSVTRSTSGPVAAVLSAAVFTAAIAAAPASAQSEPTADAASNGVDVAPPVDAPAEVVPPVPPATAATSTDATPPIVDGLAIAADNPGVPPIITASVFDDGGIASAVVRFRTQGGPWQEAPLVGGSSSMRIARLPEGAQTTGFDFYVEVIDNAGNRSSMGSVTEPLVVAPAVEGNISRVEGAARDASANAGPHPAWVMLALGTGVAAGAGAGIFGYDLGIVTARLADVDDALASNLTDERRAELERNQKQLQDAVTQDTAATAIFGVISAAAITTGIVLLAVGVAEQ